MVILGLLMMSHVLYPVVPKFGFRTLKGMLTGVFLLTMIVLAIAIPALFFFPALMGYVAYGIGKALVLGFFERLPDRDPMLDEEEGDEAGAELRDIVYDQEPSGLRGRLRKRKRDRRSGRDRRRSVGGGRSPGPSASPKEPSASQEPEERARRAEGMK
jgi:CDP-diacylglycerol--serine O-phosphatidyltransferase